MPFGAAPPFRREILVAGAYRSNGKNRFRRAASRRKQNEARRNIVVIFVVVITSLRPKRRKVRSRGILTGEPDERTTMR
jgi:hypothetical protein